LRQGGNNDGKDKQAKSRGSYQHSSLLQIKNPWAYSNRSWSTQEMG
jgi:hypothetical protein